MTKKTNKKARFADNLNQSQGSDRVYFFHMDGCGHCEQVLEIWPQVVSSITRTHPSVKFIKVESKSIDKEVDEDAKKKLQTDSIMGYPDLRILKKDGTTSTFQANRTVPELVKWIQENVTPVGINRLPTPYPVKKTNSRHRRHPQGGLRMGGPAANFMPSNTRRIPSSSSSSSSSNNYQYDPRMDEIIRIQQPTPPPSSLPPPETQEYLQKYGVSSTPIQYRSPVPSPPPVTDSFSSSPRPDVLPFGTKKNPILYRPPAPEPQPSIFSFFSSSSPPPPSSSSSKMPAPSSSYGSPEAYPSPSAAPPKPSFFSGITSFFTRGGKKKTRKTATKKRTRLGPKKCRSLRRRRV